MNFKVCGLNDFSLLDPLDRMFVDYVGFCFDEFNAEKVGNMISLDQMRSSESEILKVGVFCDQRPEYIEQVMDDYGLNLIQLNGQESPAICHGFSKRYEIIKRIPVENIIIENIQGYIDAYDADSDFFLFEIDAITTLPVLIDILAKLHIEKPFLIGGSLQSSDASILHQFVHPDFYGVDLNRIFMNAQMLPDTARIMSFMRAVTQVDN